MAPYAASLTYSNGSRQGRAVLTLQVTHARPLHASTTPGADRPAAPAAISRSATASPGGLVLAGIAVGGGLLILAGLAGLVVILVIRIAKTRRVRAAASVGRGTRPVTARTPAAAGPRAGRRRRTAERRRPQRRPPAVAGPRLPPGERNTHAGMAVRAVIFDWGGTLTPWHLDRPRRALAGRLRAALPDRSGAGEVAAAILAAERDLWQVTERSQQSATLAQVFERAGVTPTEEFLASYYQTVGPAHSHRPGGGAAAAEPAGTGHQGRGAVQHHVAAQRARAGVHARPGASS